MTTRAHELDYLAGVIHDDILQSLGLCVLEAELCLRFAHKGQRTEADAELDGMLDALQTAIAQSRRALVEVTGVGRWAAATRGTGDGEPNRIIKALDACMGQAERCRDYFRGGDDAAAFDAISRLLDQLDELGTAFRTLMGTLRRARLSA